MVVGKRYSIRSTYTLESTYLLEQTNTVTLERAELIFRKTAVDGIIIYYTTRVYLGITRLP